MNKFYIVILLIVFFGCSTPPKPIINDYIEPDISSKDYCRGNGYILSKGKFDGRLNFTFSSSRNTSYIEFKDIIGRKTLFLIISNNDIDAWDMRKNRRYNKASIYLTLPLFQIIDPSELREFLWGEIPAVFSDVKDINTQPNKLNGQLQFKSVQTEFGALVNNVSFKINEENTQLTLEIIEREFDVQYPHLIREIPESIISIDESL